MPPINWEAITAISGLMIVVGGVVRYVVKGTLGEFKEELRKEFVTHEALRALERRVELLEGR